MHRKTDWLPNCQKPLRQATLWRQTHKRLRRIYSFPHHVRQAGKQIRPARRLHIPYIAQLPIRGAERHIQLGTDGPAARLDWTGPARTGLGLADDQSRARRLTHTMEFSAQSSEHASPSVYSPASPQSTTTAPAASAQDGQRAADRNATAAPIKRRAPIACRR